MKTENNNKIIYGDLKNYDDSTFENLISKGWLNAINEEFQKDYFKELIAKISEDEKKTPIYPPANEVFTAFKLTPPENIKVVIIGQDPYHGEGEAHGLAFSVKESVKIPPSLRNILKELHSEYPNKNYLEKHDDFNSTIKKSTSPSDKNPNLNFFDYIDGTQTNNKNKDNANQQLANIQEELTPSDNKNLNTTEIINGNLASWAKQGVLLINTVLTVRKDNANSHKKIGWENFTDAVLKHIDTLEQPIVFILWGKQAEDKAKLITNKKRLVITSAHPSPLSAHRGFFGSKPFTRTNQFLINNSVPPIHWL